MFGTLSEGLCELSEWPLSVRSEHKPGAQIHPAYSLSMRSDFPNLEDRLSARERPRGVPVMHQSWDKLLFLHWRMPIEALRALIPDSLHIDTYEGDAWAAITPLTIWGLRPPFLPALPYISELHELNVRTYVHRNGIPGVWFFSLDANNSLAVLGARLFFSLPYHNANIDLEQTADRISFKSSRPNEKGNFTATWTIGDNMPAADPDSLDFFLLERYCLYTAAGGQVYRSRIHHHPWPLQQARDLGGFSSNMFEINKLPTPAEQPVLHCGGPVDVEIWPLEKI